MLKIQTMTSPVGNLTLAQKEDFLVGCWIQGQKYEWGVWKEEEKIQEETELLKKAKTWLDAYFSYQKPFPNELPLAPQGTPFQRRIWEYLCTIPYGEITTYGAIAKNLGIRSSQAVGQAIGHNPISIIIPCHRVLSAKHTLTGYAGGLEAKAWLLKHEGASI